MRILEDDVISGLTLRLTVSALEVYTPRSFTLYVGRRKENQLLENVGPEIDTIYIAEDYLDPSCYDQYEQNFIEFFQKQVV